MTAARKMFSDGSDCTQAAPKALSNGSACPAVAPKGKTWTAVDPKKPPNCKNLWPKNRDPSIFATPI